MICAAGKVFITAHRYLPTHRGSTLTGDKLLAGWTCGGINYSERVATRALVLVWASLPGGRARRCGTEPRAAGRGLKAPGRPPPLGASDVGATKAKTTLK